MGEKTAPVTWISFTDVGNKLRIVLKRYVIQLSDRKKLAFQKKKVKG